TPAPEASLQAFFAVTCAQRETALRFRSPRSRSASPLLPLQKLNWLRRRWNWRLGPTRTLARECHHRFSQTAQPRRVEFGDPITQRGLPVGVKERTRQIVGLPDPGFVGGLILLVFARAQLASSGIVRCR